MRSKWIVITGLSAASLAGCSTGRTVMEASAVTQYSTLDAELDFWDELADQRVTTNEDALHGLLMVADDSELPETWAGRVELAKIRGWIGPEDELPPNESATVGMVAIAVCDILNVKCNLTMRLFGPSGRYCTRELVYRGILPRKTDNQSMTGLEFVDLIGTVQDEEGLLEDPFEIGQPS